MNSQHWVSWIWFAMAACALMSPPMCESFKRVLVIPIIFCVIDFIKELINDYRNKRREILEKMFEK